MTKYVKCKLAVIVTMVFILLLLPCTVAFAAGKPSLSEKAITLPAGKSIDLNIKNAAKGATCTWSSGNKKIATVNKNGLVKGIAKGKTKISCKVKSAGKTYNLSADVTVILGAKTVSIQNKVEQMKVGETLDMDCVLTPGSSNDIVTWESSNDKVAAIDKDGKLTAGQIGEVQITASALSGAKEVISIKVEDENTVVFTAKDLDKDHYLLFPDRTFENVYLSNSIGKGNVKFDRCIINGTLTMEAGSQYGVEVADTAVDTIKLVTPGNWKIPAVEYPKPALYIRKGTSVKNISLEASCYFDGKEADGIGGLTISPQANGGYELLISGYHGDITIDYDKYATTRVELIGCAINKLNVDKAYGDYLNLTSNEDNPSTIDTINQKAAVMTAYDVKTNLVSIDPSVKEISLIVASPISKLVHYGADVTFMVAEDADISEIVDNKNSDGQYGKYNFCNWEGGDFAFTVKVGERLIEGARLDDFIKIFSVWTDTSKPFEVPQEKGIVMSRVDENTYLFDFNGDKVTIGFYFDKGAMTLYGGGNITLSSITLAKDKDIK